MYHWNNMTDPDSDQSSTLQQASTEIHYNRLNCDCDRSNLINFLHLLGMSSFSLWCNQYAVTNLWRFHLLQRQLKGGACQYWISHMVVWAYIRFKFPENPSCLQTTWASSSSQPTLQTVFHVSVWLVPLLVPHTSTRPSNSFAPSCSLIAPLLGHAMKELSHRASLFSSVAKLMATYHYSSVVWQRWSL